MVWLSLASLRGLSSRLLARPCKPGSISSARSILYLLAIPYALSANPVVGIAFLNLLNLCSIYLTYRLGALEDQGGRLG